MVLFWPFFQIKNIEISGSPRFSPEALAKLIESKIEKEVLFLRTASIFLADLSEISRSILQEFPTIEQVEPKRKWPSGLSVNIKERETRGWWCQIKEELNPIRNIVSNGARECFAIDKWGIIFEQASQEATPALIIISEEEKNARLGEQVLDEPIMAAVLTAYKKLREELKIEVNEFVLSANKLTARTTEGFEIYFDKTGDITQQIFNLQTLLEKERLLERENLEYIDLRFSNRVYYK